MLMGLVQTLEAGTYQGGTFTTTQSIPNGAVAYIVAPQMAGADILTAGLTVITQALASTDGQNYISIAAGTWESGPGNVDGNGNPTPPSVYVQLVPIDGNPVVSVQGLIDPAQPTSCSVDGGFYDVDGNLM
jgi:hypothetical protein